MEDAHSHKKDIVLCYLDKEAFLSSDHCQLIRVLEFLGLPQDFTRLVSILYSEASTEFITMYGHTPAVGIIRGTLQGDPVSPILFDLMIEPLFDGSTLRLKAMSSPLVTYSLLASGTRMPELSSLIRWRT